MQENISMYFHPIIIRDHRTGYIHHAINFLKGMAVVWHLICTHMLKFQGCSAAVEPMNVLNISENQAM